MADDGYEVRHAGAEAAAHVRLMDGESRRLRVLVIGQHGRDRRLVRHERPDIFGMLRDQRQGVRRAPTAGEHVDRPGSDLPR